MLAPSGATKEEAAARHAAIDTLAYLYETVVGDEGDVSALDQMDTETIEHAMALSVSGFIYNRWLDELGLSIEKGAISESAAVRLENEVRQYVESCVSLELGDRAVLEVDWAGREGQLIIDRVYRDAYSLLEAGA